MHTSQHIHNLKCAGCSSTISKTLESIPGITDIEISPKDRSVSFSYEDESDLNTIRTTLRELGYPFSEEKNNLVIKAKSYISCAKGKFTDERQAS